MTSPSPPSMTVTERAAFLEQSKDASERLDPKDTRNIRSVTHSEILEQIAQQHHVRGIVVETIRTPGETPLYVLYVLCSWRLPRYCIFHIFRNLRPRFFRVLDRLIGMVRNDFGYQGCIELRIQHDHENQPRLRKPRTPSIPKGTRI